MIDKLEMLIALAREEHFGRAAQSLGVTQPTLSAGIKQLEAQLGVQMVRRGSRFGGLTPEGRRALEWARRIVGDAKTLKEEMRATRNGLSGSVTIAVIPTALTVASRLTAPFAKAHPDVSFTILSRSAVEIHEMMVNLTADGGISYLGDALPGRMMSVPLYAEAYHLVCSQGAEIAGRDRVAWGDLAALPLCLLSPDMQNRRIIDRNLSEAGISAQTSVESNSTVVLMSHVETGGWATVLPRQLAEFLAKGRAVRAIPIDGGAAVHTVGLIAPWREPARPVVAALLKAAGEMAER